MDISEITNRLKASKDTTDQALRFIKNISLLDQSRMRNFKKIKSQAEKLKKLFDEHRSEQKIFEIGSDWSSDFINKLTLVEEKLLLQFGNDLADELQKYGYNLTGHIPLLQIGIFRIEVDVRTWSVKFWYGSKRELLAYGVLSPTDTATTIRELKASLGSEMMPNEFLNYLKSSYKELLTGNFGDPVPIIQVLDRLAPRIPTKKAENNEDRHVKYRREDFSFDLFRIRGLNGGPQLTVATRAFTKSRNNFLWIPSDENGDGSNYSHLRFLEE